MNGYPMGLAGQFRGLGMPQRFLQAPMAPVGVDRTIPGYPYGMRGMGGAPAMDLQAMPGGGYGMLQPNYPPAPMPPMMPAQQYWAAPPYFGHTPGYKDALAAAGMEFHTEVFDLAVDPIAQSGANLAAGATVIATVRISQEADFVAEKYTEFCVDTADQTDPDDVSYRVQIFDNATNRALSNQAIRVSNLAGTAQRPRILKPRLFRRNSDISFVFTNVDANPITALQLVFSGFKIFDPNSLNLNNPQ